MKMRNQLFSILGFKAEQLKKNTSENWKQKDLHQPQSVWVSFHLCSMLFVWRNRWSHCLHHLKSWKKVKIHGKPCTGIWVVVGWAWPLFPNYWGQQDSLFVAAQMNGMSLPASCALCTLSNHCQISSGYLVNLAPGMCTHGRYPVLIWLLYRICKGWELALSKTWRILSPAGHQWCLQTVWPPCRGLVMTCVGVKHLLSSSREETIDDIINLLYFISGTK